MDYLSAILARKRGEVAARLRHRTQRTHRAPVPAAVSGGRDRGQLAIATLRRKPGALPSVIAEFKRKSPSAGVIRAPERGDVARVVRQYAAAGASAVSVLCDGPGFLGSALDVRRAALATPLPVLFKEFVLDEVQVELAHAMGAHMVLLVVRALPVERLHALVDATLALGMAPVVEAADVDETKVALGTRAQIVGVNARDLRTFKVDVSAAASALALIDQERLAVHMSGIRTPEDLAEIARGCADAVLIGEGLMRAPDPGVRLSELLDGARARLDAAITR